MEWDSGGSRSHIASTTAHISRKDLRIPSDFDDDDCNDFSVSAGKRSHKVESMHG